MRKKSLVMVSLAIVFSILLTSISYADVTNNYVNPLMGGADPTIARAADGYYYCCFSGDNNITLKRSETILGVSTAKSKVVWKKPDNFGYVWGPYIYRLDGKWYIYFSSGPETDFGYGHPSSYVLENASPDPFEGTWVLKGKSSNQDEDGQITEKEGLLNTEGFGLVCGVITIKGERYLTYSKYYYFPDPKDPTKTKFDECPTIVKMSNPWTLEGEECTLARPTYDWEKKNDNVNEGCAVVERNGKIYFAYSASSFMNDNYCVGVSVADATSDIMDPASWKKHEQPILKRSDENSSYSSASPLFLKSEDGSEDLIVYHGIPTHGQGGGNRGIRVQRINWDDNDFINPGIPSNPGTVLTRPSGEEKSEIYEAEDAKLSGVTKVSGNSAFVSGSLYVKYDGNSDDDYLEFNVNTNSEGIYSLDFRYNNTTTAGAVNMKLDVNQESAGNISFAANAESVADFDIKSVYNVRLAAGSNTIRLSGNSTLALDAMIIKRSTLFEAEDAEKTGNAKVDTDHPGFSGTGFVGGLWISESSLTYNVNAANAGNYSVKTRYSLGFGDGIDRNLSLYVNDKKIKQVEFFDLKSWDKWADRYDNVFLKEGSNTITFRYDDGDSGNVNLDYITVTEAATWHYEAENAETTGSKDAKIVQANDGNTGFGYVNGLSKANSSVEFSVNIENAASYDVKLRYANPTEGKSLALYLNGTYVKDVSLPVTGGSNVWAEQLETLNLIEGKNTITYRCNTDGSGIINIDNIHLNKRTPWKYQAEQATRSGSLKVVQDHLWYDGNGFVGGFEKEGDSLQFEVNVPNTTSYTSTLRYSGAQKSNITMSMYVNEEFIKQVILPPTANWDTWTDATESVNLKAGKNVIEFIREEGDTGRFNIDSLTIDKFSGGYISSIADKIIPEKMVKIQPKHSGKALDVDRVSSDPKAVINQWANGDGNNQLWRFFDLGTGYYQIQSVQSGHVIDLLPDSPIQQICQNTRVTGGSIPDTQQWKLEKDGDYYKVINKSNGKVITVEASTNNGAKVMVADDEGKDNQRMKIEVRNLYDSEFQAVNEITQVPAETTEGQELVLFGTVSPDNATRKSIVWSVKDAGDTGATINGNIFSAPKAGTVVVTAAIDEGSAVGVDYAQDFIINVVKVNAEVSLVSVDYDLSSPGDVSTSIIWNAASSVANVVNGESYLTTPEMYVVTGSALVIKDSYLASLELENGDATEFKVYFDKGTPATFVVNIIDSSDPTPVNRKISVDSDENGTASASAASAQAGTEITLTATPNQGYRLKEWQVIYPADLSITGNTFIMPNGAVSIKAIFEEKSTENYTLTVNGSYAANSGAGIYAEGSVVTINAGSRSNYTFRGWNSEDDVSFADRNSTITTVTMPAINVAVTAEWAYNGSSGGSGGSGGSSTPSTPATKSYTADIKVMDAAGNGTEDITLPISVDAKAGTAALDMASNKNLLMNGGISVVTVPTIPDVDTYIMGIPVSYLSTTVSQGAMKFNTDSGSITVNSNMLTGTIAAAGTKAEISIGQGDKAGLSQSAKTAIGNRPLIKLSMTIDGKPFEWNNPDVPVTVTIPYTPTASELANPESIIIWYIDDSGEMVAIPNGRYDLATGTVSFNTTHFSYYAVGYNAVSFADIKDNSWYSKAVNFIAARNITSGTGNGNFSPNAKLTRSEFIVMLMKAYGIAPDADWTNNFSDAGNTYYTGYLAAAKRLGISGGVGNNMFAPGKEITRQEMFTLLYNALNTMGKLPQGSSGKSLSDFSDVDKISSWARDAMTLMVETGTVGGNAGQLTPISTTTRAEMAQVLYNLMSK